MILQDFNGIMYYKRDFTKHKKLCNMSPIFGIRCYLIWEIAKFEFESKSLKLRI